MSESVMVPTALIELRDEAFAALDLIEFIRRLLWDVAMVETDRATERLNARQSFARIEQLSRHVDFIEWTLRQQPGNWLAAVTGSTSTGLLATATAGQPIGRTAHETVATYSRWWLGEIGASVPDPLPLVDYVSRAGAARVVADWQAYISRVVLGDGDPPELDCTAMRRLLSDEFDRVVKAEPWPVDDPTWPLEEWPRRPVLFVADIDRRELDDYELDVRHFLPIGTVSTAPEILADTGGPSTAPALYELGDDRRSIVLPDGKAVPVQPAQFKILAALQSRASIAIADVYTPRSKKKRRRRAARTEEGRRTPKAAYEMVRKLSQAMEIAGVRTDFSVRDGCFVRDDW